MRIDFGQYMGLAHGSLRGGDRVAKLVETVGQLASQITGPSVAGRMGAAAIGPAYLPNRSAGLSALVNRREGDGHVDGHDVDCLAAEQGACRAHQRVDIGSTGAR